MERAVEEVSKYAKINVPEECVNQNLEVHLLNLSKYQSNLTHSLAGGSQAELSLLTAAKSVNKTQVVLALHYH